MSEPVACLAFFAVTYAILLFFYFLTNGVVYWILHSGRWGSWANYRIQADRPPAAGQVRREILLSVVNLAFFALTCTGLFVLYRHGWTRIYANVWDAPRGWFLLSIVIMLVIHEAYFYWLHRLLHWKPLFRHVHRVHHLSLAPTPWAAYAAHPVEGFLLSGNLALYAFLFPVHPLAVLSFVFTQNMYNTLGHCGHDSPSRPAHSRWYHGWHNSPSHHDAHHRYMNGNYGHYVNVWDRLLGTELPEYRMARRPETGLGDARQEQGASSGRSRAA